MYRRWSNPRGIRQGAFIELFSWNPLCAYTYIRHGMDGSCIYAYKHAVDALKKPLRRWGVARPGVGGWRAGGTERSLIAAIIRAFVRVGGVSGVTVSANRAPGDKLYYKVAACSTYIDEAPPLPPVCRSPAVAARSPSRRLRRGPERSSAPQPPCDK